MIITNDITLHNDLLKNPAYVSDFVTKSLEMIHMRGCIP